MPIAAVLSSSASVAAGLRSGRAARAQAGALSAQRAAPRRPPRRRGATVSTGMAAPAAPARPRGMHARRGGRPHAVRPRSPRALAARCNARAMPRRGRVASSVRCGQRRTRKKSQPAARTVCLNLGPDRGTPSHRRLRRRVAAPEGEREVALRGARRAAVGAGPAAAPGHVVQRERLARLRRRRPARPGAGAARGRLVRPLEQVPEGRGQAGLALDACARRKALARRRPAAPLLADRARASRLPRGGIALRVPLQPWPAPRAPSGQTWRPAGGAPRLARAARAAHPSARWPPG